jgi:hypothetical protein
MERFSRSTLKLRAERSKNPMTRNEVAGQARSLMEPVLGVTVCNSLIEREHRPG